MERKKILMPIMEIGGGHKFPAFAVRDAIEEKYPGKYQMNVVDFAFEAGALVTDKMLKNGWDFSLSHRGFIKMVYRFFRDFHPLFHYLFPIVNHELYRKGIPYIKNYKPDIVFSTHFACIMVSAAARKKLKLPFKVIGYDTDPFDGASWWAVKQADMMLAASEESKSGLRRNGVPFKKLKVLPFPIHKKFFQVTKTPEETRKELGIDPSHKTILATAGGQGIGKLSRYLADLYEKGLPFNIIFVCGKNEVLFQKLSDLSKTPSETKLIPLGFVTNMNELYQVSDIAVIKAGASTTFEALLSNVPPLFTDWAVYNEKPNLDFVVKQKIGWYAGNEREFFSILNEILKTDILNEYKGKLKNLHMETGADKIADYIVSELEKAPS